MNEPTNQPTAKKVNRWRARLIVFVCLIAIYAAYRFVLFGLVSARIHAVRSSGLPASLAELDKWYPQVPAGENAAESYLLADERCNKWTNALSRKVVLVTNCGTIEATKKSDLLPLVGFAKCPSRTERFSPEAKQLVGDYLADNVEALGILHEAAKKSQCRFPVDFSKRSTGTLSYLSLSRHAARLLTLEAMESAENQQANAAAESLIAQIALVRAFNGEPSLISYLSAMALQGMTIASAEQVINKTPLSNDQLTRVATSLQDLDESEGLFRAMVAERCSGVDMCQRITFADLISLFGSEKPLWFAAFCAIYRPSGLLDQDELADLQMMNGLVQAARLPPPKNIFAAQQVITSTQRIASPALIAKWHASLFDRTIIQGVQAVARKHTAVVGLAIERYRLQTGHLPESLDELVPAFLPAIPQDPFDGKPQRYKRNVHGYVVYSVGEDGKDDGGAEKNAAGLIRGPGTDITFIVEH
jgi:hypothetical protein